MDFSLVWSRLNVFADPNITCYFPIEIPSYVYNYTISSFVKTANTISKVLRFQYIKTT